MWMNSGPRGMMMSGRERWTQCTRHFCYFVCLFVCVLCSVDLHSPIMIANCSKCVDGILMWSGRKPLKINLRTHFHSFMADCPSDSIFHALTLDRPVNLALERHYTSITVHQQCISSVASREWTRASQLEVVYVITVTATPLQANQNYRFTFVRMSCLTARSEWPSRRESQYVAV